MRNISSEKYFSQWKYYWSRKNFRIQLVISLTVLASFTIIFPHFFDFIETRPGTILHDPLLEMLPSADVSWLIFALIYFGVISWIVTSIKKPEVLLTGVQTYCLVTILRLISIPLFPLEPPEKYVPLIEPVVQFFTNGGRIISRDLFFSGHMTTILFCYFNKEKGLMKTTYLLSSLAIGSLLMIQHVHYTIDILAAPLFTWLCFLFVKKVLASRI